MLRRALHILFTAVFALLASGFVASVHLCQDQVKSLDWFSADAERCCNKKTADHDADCCSTLTLQFEQDKASMAPSPELRAPQPTGDVEPFPVIDTVSETTNEPPMAVQARDPIPRAPLWLQYQELRIPDPETIG